MTLLFGFAQIKELNKEGPSSLPVTLLDGSLLINTIDSCIIARRTDEVKSKAA